MKASAARDDLHKALSFVSRHADKGLVVPVLGCVMLTAEVGVLHLQATNMDVWASAPCAADIHETGVVLVKADVLAPLVAKMSADAVVSLSVDGKFLVVASGRARARIPTLPVEDFPSRPEDKASATIKIAAKKLATLIDSVIFAADDGSRAFYLAGVHLMFRGNREMRAAASDGNRLAMAYLDLGDSAPDGFPQAILPTRGAAGILSLCKKESGDATLTISEGHIAVRLESGETFLTRVIDGTFPDVERLRPHSEKFVATIDRASLSRALASVAVFSDLGSRPGVRMKFSDAELYLEPSTNARGDGRFPVDVDYEGESFEIGLSTAFLSDAIGAGESETVCLGSNGGVSPVTIRDRTDSRDIHIIMPMGV